MRTLGRSLSWVFLVATLSACPSTRVLAWNQVTHQYINGQLLADFPGLVPPDYESLFVYAGSYPDAGYGIAEMANRFQAPAPKREPSELVGIDWQKSANFAALWLQTVALGADYPEPYPAIGKGWGSHIASDWVAHTWLPLADDLFYNAWHLDAEVYVDAYVMWAHGYRRLEAFTVRCDPRFLRGLLISHALVDYGRVTKYPADLQLFKEGLAAWNAFDLATIESKLESFPAAVVGANVLAYSVIGDPLKLERMLRWADKYNFESLLELSVGTARTWVNPNTTSYYGIPLFPVDPLYDPTAPPTKPPPGSVTPPVAQGLSTSGGSQAATAGQTHPHDSLYEILGVIADRATDTGLVSVTRSPVGDGTGMVDYTAEVRDEEAFLTLATTTLRDLARGEGGSGMPLSPAAAVLARSLDRLVNDGLDPEAAADMLPPYVIPLTPKPNEVAHYLRPLITVAIEDVQPSAGLDPASLVVRIDGGQLQVTLPEGTQSFSERPSQPIYEGPIPWPLKFPTASGRGPVSSGRLWWP